MINPKSESIIDKVCICIFLMFGIGSVFSIQTVLGFIVFTFWMGTVYDEESKK